MKKILCLILAAAALFVLPPCCYASEGTAEEQLAQLQEKYDQLLSDYEALQAQLEGQETPDDGPASVQAEIKTPGVFNKDEVISQLEVRELSMTGIWDYYFLVVKNNSAFDLDLTVELRYYDGNDKLVGVEKREEYAVEAGYPVVFWFMPDEEYARVEYTFSAKEEDWYEPVISDLSYEESVTDNKVILMVTNNGEKAAEFVEGTVLFYKNGELVNFDWTYFTDDDSEIKPGDTIIQELHCYGEFDSHEVYFTGRR